MMTMSGTLELANARRRKKTDDTTFQLASCNCNQVKVKKIIKSNDMTMKKKKKQKDTAWLIIENP